MSKQHFYIQQIIHGTRQDGGLQEMASRHGDYPSREIAEEKLKDRQELWDAEMTRNPNSKTFQAVTLNVVEGFWGYKE